MTQGQQWGTLGFVLCLGLGIVCYIATASDKDDAPTDAIAHIGPNDSPVYSADSVDEIEDQFRLIRLSDGHDYWFYRDSSRDRGFASMAHSPECQTCVSQKAAEATPQMEQPAG